MLDYNVLFLQKKDYNYYVAESKLHFVERKT